METSQKTPSPEPASTEDILCRQTRTHTNTSRNQALLYSAESPNTFHEDRRPYILTHHSPPNAKIWVELTHRKDTSQRSYSTAKGWIAFSTQNFHHFVCILLKSQKPYPSQYRLHALVTYRPPPPLHARWLQRTTYTYDPPDVFTLFSLVIPPLPPSPYPPPRENRRVSVTNST